jgi:hypothetical protein
VIRIVHGVSPPNSGCPYLRSPPVRRKEKCKNDAAKLSKNTPTDEHR